MTDGFALAGAGPAPKRRGRPPGSTNKRAKDLVGFLDAKCGGSAALQLAQGCMVTVAEVKAAGGSLQKAELAKARRLVEAFEAERERLAGQYRDLVRAVLLEVFEEVATAEAAQVKSIVLKNLRLISGPGGALTLRDALDRMAEDRRALLPYTDQRQAQQVNVKGDGFAPVMVFMGGEPGQIEKPQQKQGLIEGAAFEVLQPKSHGEQEA